ncbi:WD40-repeat-containing domain protein, partial [Ganoderma leucocontextum]
HSDTITCVAFNQDGKLLASASLDGNLCIWNVKTGSLCYQYFSGHAVLSIVWADLERILCGLKDGSIACVVINSETKSLDVTGTWGHSYPVEVLTVMKNRLASGAHKELFIWPVMSYHEREVTLSELSELGPDEDVPVVTALHWSGRDGGGAPTLLIVGYIQHGIRYAGHLITDTNPDLLCSGSASVSPDNKYLAVSNVFTGFHIYRLDNGSPIAHFEQEGNEARPLPVVWLHGGRAILGGSTLGSINIWYIDTGRKVVSL